MPLVAQAVATEYEGAAAVGLALRRLGTVKRVLMIAAHPDDEATQVLSALALGQGADVAYLSLTRGEGGQNGIGGELREGLGLLRSEELLAARRLDGARQYFTRAIDFGFSKSADEALTVWPREELLRDVVAVIRHFRPDVIVSVFTGTPRDGHGQHQAAGIMAREGFAAAGDPSRFPELRAEGLEPHTPVHLFQLLRGPDEEPAAVIETGELDPLLGRSHYQVAMASRSRHRSQDMGQVQAPGRRATTLTLIDTRAATPPVGSIFAGIDTTLAARIAGLLGTSVAGATSGAAARGSSSVGGTAGRGGSSGGSGSSSDRSTDATETLLDLLADYEVAVAAARDAFNPLRPEPSVDELVRAAGALDGAIALLPSDNGGAREASFLLAAERSRLSMALRQAARVEVDAIADDEAVVPGQTFELQLQLWNGGTRPVSLTALQPVLPDGWRAAARETLPPTVGAGELVVGHFDVTVPPDAEPTQPYFLRLPRDGSMYAWPEDFGSVGVPFEPSPVRAAAAIAIGGAAVVDTVEGSFLGVDSRSGEFRRPVRVVPGVAVTVEPELAVFVLARSGEPRGATVTLRSEVPGGVRGELRISVPPEWDARPATVPMEFGTAGEERTVEVAIRSPSNFGAGRYEVEAVFVGADGAEYDQGYALVDYPHINPRPLYRSSTIGIQAIDVQVPERLRVGYVAAAGDNVPAALAQLGVAVEMLGAAQLAAAPLDGFDVIVVGSRAYEGRPDLVTHNQRLLDYVRRGGTMIVQYNQYEYTEPSIAPYPVTMARPHDRVTDEAAEVRVLQPEHPVFTTPNRITAEDFDGWVQERGLYFLTPWDDAFTPLLEMADPGEEPKRGALLVAQYGEGTYVYTGLALFRQLAAGVPGAYRLFANLLALGVE